MIKERVKINKTKQKLFRQRENTDKELRKYYNRYFELYQANQKNGYAVRLWDFDCVKDKQIYREALFLNKK